MTTTKTFKWTKMWGIDAEFGAVEVGEVVTMQKQNGTESQHEVGAVMPYRARNGEARVMALVFGEGA